jgi:hypothetical protein
MKDITKAILRRPRNKLNRKDEAKVLKYFRSMGMRETVLTMLTGKVSVTERD